jgi:hypothetical protein
VTDKLRSLWSPEQIAGWLKHAHPHDENHRVSHETIYRTLFIQALQRAMDMIAFCCRLDPLEMGLGQVPFDSEMDVALETSRKQIAGFEEINAAHQRFRECSIRVDSVSNTPLR